MRNEFTAIVEQDGEWFIAYCAEVPGANGQGKSREECVANLDCPHPGVQTRAILACTASRRQAGTRCNRMKIEGLLRHLRLPRLRAAQRGQRARTLGEPQ